MKWQPIETAPRDGTKIDLWASGQRWADCSWTGSCWFTPDIYDCGAEMERFGHHPTHWMPVPPPPMSESDIDDFWNGCIQGGPETCR